MGRMRRWVVIRFGREKESGRHLSIDCEDGAGGRKCYSGLGLRRQ